MFIPVYDNSMRYDTRTSLDYFPPFSHDKFFSHFLTVYLFPSVQRRWTVGVCDMSEQD